MSINYSIFVEGLVIGYGSVKVIEGLNMKVPAGSIYGLLGPSMLLLLFIIINFNTQLLL